MAGDNGVYHPVQAISLRNNQIMLMPNANVPRPASVRYGWQPFTRANLVNSDGLPASTFKIKIENMEQLYQQEPGFERGVSAPFAGIMPDGRIIMAGGCNFPTDDPFAPSAQKKTYEGIYSYANGEWNRIGSLSEPTAYGATVSTADGIVLIGGVNPQGSSSKVTLLKPDLSTRPLPSLPAAIDNMAAAAIGRKIYVAGGNADGKPSANLYMLDLENPVKGWKKLKSMPGNPRVQPVMAAAQGKLYVWGGFAGRHDGHEPTLELDGLCFDPESGKWTAVQGPRKADGTPVATGGGIAVTLTDGRIAVAGGVNKDVFLAALINQAPDYLNHPIGWYAFNPTVFCFNPASQSWTEGPTDPLNARAGAAALALPSGEMLLIGGELKPRIRTPRTITVKP